MKLRTYDLTETGGCTAHESSEMAPEWFADDVVRWIDVMADDTVEIEGILDPLELHESIKAAAAATDTRPEVIAFEKLLFVRMPYFGRDGKSHFLRLICGPTAVVSTRTAPLVEIDNLAAALKSGDRQLQPTVADLLIEILEATLREARSAANKLRDQIDELSEKLETDSGEVMVGDLLALKRRTSGLASLIEDQLICTGNLSAVRSNTLSLAEVKDDLQVITKVLEQIRPIVLRHDEQARELRQAHAGLMQEVSNRRLNLLAILSAIYLPSTLIAGIFGMNFTDIPMTGMSGGYNIVFFLMIALVVGQLVFFWRRGWFS